MVRSILATEPVDVNRSNRPPKCGVPHRRGKRRSIAYQIAKRIEPYIVEVPVQIIVFQQVSVVSA